ncbi:MAG: hypothetical protein AAGA23_05755 [Pseudomonadota bacterium]
MANLLGKLLTRSFPGKSETAFAPLGVDPKEVKEEKARGYESRAFALWADQFEQLEEAGRRVLDLGRMNSTSFQYLSQLSAGVGVMDLNVELTGTAFQMQLTEHADWGPFHGVLAWDRLNYLGADELALLGDWLEERTQPGALLFACLATRTPYATRPANYRIEDARTLSVAQEDGGQERTRRHTPSMLKRALSAFTSSRSFLLRDGMQEHVLVRN